MTTSVGFLGRATAADAGKAGIGGHCLRDLGARIVLRLRRSGFTLFGADAASPRSVCS